MNVLTQYGVNSIDARALPEPSNPADQVVVIYLDENTGVDDPDLGIVMCEPGCDSAFGYHFFFTTAAGHRAERHRTG